MYLSLININLIILIIFSFFFLENLPPAELKKLRNKQRKAKKKAELESQQAAQAQVKKEQHNKSRQAHNQDGDPEAPQLDELIPDKLARPEDPLEKAIDFLRPLQQLAKDNIETHLMAFEIYFRKNKLLLMLQSIKRARKIDSNNAVLHSCILKFQKVLKATADLNSSVKLVIEKEINIIFNGRDAKELNRMFLEKFSNSYQHVHQVARSIVMLDSTTKNEAIKLVTDFKSGKVTLAVS